MPNITRSTINLPAEVSSEIIQKVQEQSAVMQLARQMTLPGRGVSIPVITGDPEAAWVGEGNRKPVSNASLSTKLLTPYKLAVVEVFSMEFVRDAKVLYDELIKRLPLALAAKFDATVFGGVDAPGDNFDTLAGATAQSINDNVYDGLVAADTDVSTHGGIVNGYVIAPQGKGKLLGAKDSTGRPIFINSVAEGAIPMILGAKTLPSKGAYVPGDATESKPETLGFTGDWNQAVYGTVEGVQISISDQATIVSGNDTINLWQDNMVAVRAEIELGFRADTDCFNKLTGATPTPEVNND